MCRSIIWNGIARETMIEVSNAIGINRMTFKRYYDLGLRSNTDIEAFKNKICIICNQPIPAQSQKYCSPKCSAKSQRAKNGNY